LAETLIDIEPSLSLAVSIQSAPGLFAILIGSGVSRPAGILTGNEITLDLARRVATEMGEDAGNDPAAWFERRKGSRFRQQPTAPLQG
jgi:hypothetical protein